MNRVIAAAVLLFMVPIAGADDRKEPKSTIPYVKEAECVNIIANLALVNPVMGEISMAMLGRYPACEVVSIVREAQRLSDASNISKTDVTNRTYSDIVGQAEKAMEDHR